MMEIYSHYKNKLNLKELEMTKEDKVNFKNATHCWICKKEFEEENKVKDPNEKSEKDPNEDDGKNTNERIKRSFSSATTPSKPDRKLRLSVSFSGGIFL
mgnify:CR=1 FL=1